jgi:EAL and modified HD-GYP domain-containing signal transduction protein
LSLIDVLLDQPLAQILAALPLAAGVADTLLGQPTAIRPVYDLAVAYERADWDAISRHSAALGVAASDVQADYLQALQWADACSAPAAAA